jgi:hypothetical protein
MKSIKPNPNSSKGPGQPLIYILRKIVDLKTGFLRKKILNKRTINGVIFKL